MAKRMVQLLMGLTLSGVVAETQTRAFDPIAHGPFWVQSYLGKCLTHGTVLQPSPGGPASGGVIYMAECPSGWPVPNEDLLQRIIVTEISAKHDVVLDVGGKVIGVRGNDLSAGAPLEVQDYTGADGQVWAFDGDTLMLRANRNLVAEVRNGRTPSQTPVVLGSRDLDDAEFWRFVAVDGTNKKPTSGFVRVPQETDLRSALDDASWGTVIEIDNGVWIPLDDCFQPGACPGPTTANFPLLVHAGVTLRGNRHGVALGPLLTVSTYPWNAYRIFEIVGNQARITGLRLSGPSPDKDEERELSGIFVDDDEVRRPIIDHNEMLGWTEAAVHVNSWDDRTADDFYCTPHLDRPRTARVVRNFLHHNARKGLGYGVTIHSNGFASILGNTFLYNRHAVAADGLRATGYTARFNLVLSDAPEYGWTGSEHDFDMHGTDRDYSGGIAGSDVDIARNTFLGENPTGPDTRYHYDVRGVPCALHRFRNNVTVQGQFGAIHWYGQPSPTAPPPAWLEISNNTFNSPNPTRRLGAGDFDGDGTQDLFLATGAAWYYAPGAAAEWRYRNDVTIGMDDLLFGDIDGDGRTDVLDKRGSTWSVSWAGGSTRESINASSGPITDYALGDFDGDGRADIFHATGTEWLVSYGGMAPFVLLSPSPQRVSDLRFGDFDGDGRADVFAVMGGVWYMRRGGRSLWTVLRVALTPSVDNLVVADFNGDGRSDVALSDSSTWKVSLGATGGWITLRTDERDLDDAVAIGPFDGLPGADVLAWEDLLWFGDWRHLRIFSGGWVDQHRHSRWHMR